jgi:hypothetical protein
VCVILTTDLSTDGCAGSSSCFPNVSRRAVSRRTWEKRRAYNDGFHSLMRSLVVGGRAIAQWKERISMLKRPSLRLSRHLFSIALSLSVAVSAAYPVRAAQPNALQFPVLMTVKLTVSDSNVLSTTTESTEILLTSGETTTYLPGSSPTSKGYRVECGTAAAASPASGDQGNYNVAPGGTRLLCTVTRGDALVWTPSLLLTDEKVAGIESSDAEHALRYKLELMASMSKGRLAAAQSNAAH